MISANISSSDLRLAGLVALSGVKHIDTVLKGNFGGVLSV